MHKKLAQAGLLYPELPVEKGGRGASPYASFAAGAMWEAEGVGIHPLKFTYGLIRKARALGVKLHTARPVQAWETMEGVHHLHTPGGIVRTRRVTVCTGGYTGQALSPLTKNKLLPILSNNLVTKPLTEAQIEAAGLKTRIFLTDTRTLRFYYRLLGDKRLQIGSRSAVTGADATHPRHMAVLVNGLHRKFPALRGIDIEHSWWGWVDVSHDMMPRIMQPEEFAAFLKKDVETAERLLKSAGGFPWGAFSSM